uniref:Secreted protein n=1 Tax=Anopheles darlingi TaxID=43151 RepID=A0A2M4DD11_ANODA
MCFVLLLLAAASCLAGKFTIFTNHSTHRTSFTGLIIYLIKEHRPQQRTLVPSFFTPKTFLLPPPTPPRLLQRTSLSFSLSLFTLFLNLLLSLWLSLPLPRARTLL